MTALLSVLYASTATTPFSEVDLAVLLSTSRLNNERNGLSGMLMYREGYFMQVLEGSEEQVTRTLGTISADRRHTSLRILEQEVIPGRRFGSWAMGYRSTDDLDGEQLPTWFGSPEVLQRHDDSRTGEFMRWFRDS